MVYLFVLVFFIPWPFYKDIVAATSGGGNRDVMKDLDAVETGRLLHRFPHNKVRVPLTCGIEFLLIGAIALVVPVRHSFFAEYRVARHR